MFNSIDEHLSYGKTNMRNLTGSDILDQVSGETMADQIYSIDRVPDGINMTLFFQKLQYSSSMISNAFPTYSSRPSNSASSSLTPSSFGSREFFLRNVVLNNTVFLPCFRSLTYSSTIILAIFLVSLQVS